MLTGPLWSCPLWRLPSLPTSSWSARRQTQKSGPPPARSWSGCAAPELCADAQLLHLTTIQGCTLWCKLGVINEVPASRRLAWGSSFQQVASRYRLQQPFGNFVGCWQSSTWQVDRRCVCCGSLYLMSRALDLCGALASFCGMSADGLRPMMVSLHWVQVMLAMFSTADTSGMQQGVVHSSLPMHQ